MFPARIRFQPPPEFRVRGIRALPQIFAAAITMPTDRVRLLPRQFFERPMADEEARQHKENAFSRLGRSCAVGRSGLPRRKRVLFRRFRLVRLLPPSKVIERLSNIANIAWNRSRTMPLFDSPRLRQSLLPVARVSLPLLIKAVDSCPFTKSAASATETPTRVRIRRQWFPAGTEATPTSVAPPRFVWSPDPE